MRRILPLILIAQFTIPLSIAGTAVALPTIAEEFNPNPALLQWSVNAFNISFALATVLWGVLADRIGHRATFLAGIWLAVAASCASAMAADLLTLDIARALAGIAAGAVLTGAATLLTVLFEGDERRRAFTWFGVVNGLGLAAGPALSGLLVGAAGWRAPYVVQGVVLAAAGIAAVPLPHTPRTGREGRLLDFAALRNPRFAAMSIVPVAGAIGFVALLTYGPTALEATHGWSPTAAGTFMLIMTIPVVLAPPVVHRFHDPVRLASVALACLVVGLLGMLLLRPETAIYLIVVPMVLLGLGFGIPLGFVDREALGSVPAARAGAAAGVFNLIRIGSEAVAVLGFGALLAALVTRHVTGTVADQVAAGAPGHPDVFYAAFTPTVLGCAVACTVCWVGFLALVHRERDTSCAPTQNLAGSR